jgi:hypothetical protein
VERCPISLPLSFGGRVSRTRARWRYDDAALERRTQIWRRLIEGADDSARMFLAESAGSVVGVGRAAKSPYDRPARELGLRCLYVLGTHCGTCAGQALLDAVFGQDTAQLWVAADNHRSGRSTGATDSFPTAWRRSIRI